MDLGARIQTILKERNLKQVEFAKAMGISANYVNLLVNHKKTRISETLAKLIEETYGYNARWVMEGTGDKLAGDVSASKAEILKKIQRMSDEEVRAVMAFVRSLESVRADFPEADD